MIPHRSTHITSCNMAETNKKIPCPLDRVLHSYLHPLMLRVILIHPRALHGHGLPVNLPLRLKAPLGNIPRSAEDMMPNLRGGGTGFRGQAHRVMRLGLVW